MPRSFIQTSFGTGEVSPQLSGRVDLTKYATAATTMRNFLVDYRGGASSRAGTQLVGPCFPGIVDGVQPRLIPFVFNSDQPYVLVLYHGRMRVVYRGGFILEAAKTITTAMVPNGASLVLDVSDATGLNVHDTVYINGAVNGPHREGSAPALNERYFRITAISGTQVTLVDEAGLPISTADWDRAMSGGYLSRVYEVNTPWDDSHIADLKFAQSADVMTVTHPAYFPYNVSRYGNTDWRIEYEDFNTPDLAPIDIVATPINEGAADKETTSTTEFSDGTHSTTTNVTPGNAADTDFFYVYGLAGVDQDGAESGAALITCVNKSLNTTDGVVNKLEWTNKPGVVKTRIYKGQVVPNGRQGSSPFVLGLIGTTTGESYQDLNYAPNYDKSNRQGYNPFDGTTGIDMPAVVSYYQQRRVYAASDRKPATIWFTRPGQYNNFDYSEPSQDDDSITATLSGAEVNIVRSLVPLSSSLIALTSGSIYEVRGSSDSGLSPATISANPQTYSGATGLQPLRINVALLYMQARGAAVRELTYSNQAGGYTGKDISLLSAHLFTGLDIKAWAWAEEPDKVVWAVRNDGVLLSLTYVPDQEVYGWARHDTAGRFCDVAAIPEDTEDGVYVVAYRYSPEKGFQYFIERMQSRLMGANLARGKPANRELSFCMDCGIRKENIITGTTTATCDAAPVDGYIWSVDVVTPGSGYAAGDVFGITDQQQRGTGASLSVSIVDGQVVSATIVAPGSGYRDPVVEPVGAHGSGASFVIRTIRKQVITASADLFTSDDFSQTIRVGGGKGRIMQVVDARNVVVDMVQPITDVVPGQPEGAARMWPQVAGTWSVGRDVSYVTALDHLEGLTVQVLADGGVQAPQVVKNGTISLESPASVLCVGLGYVCQLETPRFEQQSTAGTLQGKRTTFPSVSLLTINTHGLLVGQDWTNMTEAANRQVETFGYPEPYMQQGVLSQVPYEGAPTAFAPLRYEMSEYHIANQYDTRATICIQQSYPLPATVLAIMPDTLIGDMDA